MASCNESTTSINNAYEEYKLAYSKYLLAKLQNHVAQKQKKEKEDECKKCLISLKLEFEELLQKHVALRKDVFHLKLFLDFMREIKKNIEAGNEILKTLEGNGFDELLIHLSKSLKVCKSHLKLVNVNKDSFQELFDKKVFGSGSEMEKNLQLINEFISKNNLQISKIADELRDVQSLWTENSILRERFAEIINSASNEILDTNYKLFVEKINSSIQAKDELVSNGCPITRNLINIQDLFRTSPKVEDSLEISKIEKSQKTTFLQITQLEGNDTVNPRVSSTPKVK